MQLVKYNCEIFYFEVSFIIVFCCHSIRILLLLIIMIIPRIIDVLIIAVTNFIIFVNINLVIANYVYIKHNIQLIFDFICLSIIIIQYNNNS